MALNTPKAARKKAGNLFLRIQNPGVCDPELFKLLGATTKGQNDNMIGQFGSGNKFGVAVCLRHGIKPVVWCGHTRLSFGTVEKKIDGKIFEQLVCHETDSRTSQTKESELGFVLDYGALDWDDVSMGLREFVSNALDACIPGEYDQCIVDLAHDPNVHDNDSTTVYVPVNDGVLKFYDDLDKWFLHFSEPEFLNKSVLPKTRSRSLNKTGAACIYRRGCLVRQVQHMDCARESLFDYNFSHINIDEARKLDDYSVKRYAANALRDSTVERVAEFFKSIRDCHSDSYDAKGKKWEHEFNAYELQIPLGNGIGKSGPDEIKRATWQTAYRQVFGEHVVTCNMTADIVSKKGYKPLVLRPSLVEVCAAAGIRTTKSILNEDERSGIMVVPVTKDMETAMKDVWQKIVCLGMHAGLQMPAMKAFVKSMNAGRIKLGFYRDKTVYINQDIGGNCTQLYATVLEELAHYITGANDESRDLQDFAFTFAVRAMK